MANPAESFGGKYELIDFKEWFHAQFKLINGLFPLGNGNEGEAIERGFFEAHGHKKVTGSEIYDLARDIWTRFAKDNLEYIEMSDWFGKFKHEDIHPGNRPIITDAAVLQIRKAIRNHSLLLDSLVPAKPLSEPMQKLFTQIFHGAITNFGKSELESLYLEPLLLDTKKLGSLSALHQQCHDILQRIKGDKIK